MVKKIGIAVPRVYEAKRKESNINYYGVSPSNHWQRRPMYAMSNGQNYM